LNLEQGPLGYFADMLVSPLLAGGLSTFALTHFTNYALACWLATVMLGVALRTLIEYVTHRMIYHRVAAFKKYHEAHHADPQAYIGAPPLLGASVVFLISFVPVATFAPRHLSLSCAPPSRGAPLSRRRSQFWRHYIVLGSRLWNTYPTRHGPLVPFFMTSRRPTSIATSWAATLLKGGDALAARDRSHFPRHFLPPLASKSCSDYSVIWEKEIRHE